MNLLNRKIILGIAGSVAAYKSLELIRLLKKQGALVHAIPTPKALDFITQLSIHALTDFNPNSDHFSHIHEANQAELLLIAPATANLIAKMAHGHADNLLLQTYLAYSGPVLLAPAMESNMWNHPATQENIQILKKYGVQIIQPESGELASGYSGIGRLASLENIVEHTYATLSPQDFTGQKVLITAGPTQEPIDPVRYLTNYSSGKMGIALARALWQRGAQVTLIHGPLSTSIPTVLSAIPVRTAQDMHEQVLKRVCNSDIAILCAAVADFRPTETLSEKIKKTDLEHYSLALSKNPDMLQELGQQSIRPFLVGFAAESSDLENHAWQKCRSKNCDLICANLINIPDSGFGSDDNQVSIFNRNGFVCALERQTKNTIAHCILDVILKEKNICSRSSGSQNQS